MSRNPTLVINDKTVSRLETLHLSVLVAGGKKRRLSSSVLSHSHAAADRLSLGSDETITSRSFAATDSIDFEDEFLLPVELESAESYEFIGFVKEVAEKLFRDYESLDSDNPYGFWDLVVSRIDNSADDVLGRK